MIKEIWKPIKDFENIYEISNLGRVKSVERFVFCKSKTNPNKIKECILKQRLDKYGYLIVNLKKNQKTYIKKIHRLIAEAFIENTYNLSTVNHKDGNKLNNSIENLEWLSFTDNARHRTNILLTKPKLSKNEIEYIIKYTKKSKNQFDNEFSISNMARKFNVCRNTIYDVINNKKLYLKELLCN